MTGTAVTADRLYQKAGENSTPPLDPDDGPISAKGMGPMPTIARPSRCARMDVG
jgi:hypothetical protein